MIDNWTTLQPWLQPQHLTSEAINAFRIRFNKHSAQVLQINDFWQGDIAEKVGHFLVNEAVYQSVYGLYSVEKHRATAEQWIQAPDIDRFYHYGMLSEGEIKARLSPNLLTFIRLRQFLTTPPFKRYMQAITGFDLVDMERTTVHKMGAEHQLQKHNDTDHGRIIALVFYLSPNWPPCNGGALHIVERNGVTSMVNATFNSMVLFNVKKHAHHYVTPVTDAAAGRYRLTIGTWFSGK